MAMPDTTMHEPAFQTPPSLEARIYAAYPQLSPAERRFADILLEQQMNLAKRTAGELARKAGVSQSTAARLIRVLGYASYPDAKRHIRSEQHWGSPRADLPASRQAPSDTASLARMVQADIDNIQATAANISERTLHAVSEALVTAKRIWIVGLRSGYGLAQHAGHYFGLIRKDVHVLSGSEPTYSRWIASIEKGDLLLVVAFRRRPRLLPDIIREARKAGAVTVLITDLSAAASASASTHVLRCRCHSPSPFNTFSAAVTLINYLAWSVTERLGESSHARFETIDRLVKLMDDVSLPREDKR